MSAKTYLKFVAAITALLAAIVVAVNWTVDPFDVTGAARVEGFNDRKVAINSRIRLAKAFQIERGAWDVVIAGNSRVEMGLDPSHRCFAELDLRAYNAGIPGASVEEQILYALNIASDNDVRTVLLAIDYTDFLVVPDSPPPDAPVDGYASPHLGYTFGGDESPGFRAARLMDLYRALFSLDALTASARTVALQGRGGTTRTPAGFNPADDFLAAIAVEGVRALFEQKIAALDERFAGKTWALDHGSEMSSAEGALRRFLDLASERGIDVVLYTNPFHDAYLELLAAHGTDAHYAAWFERMTAIAAEYPAVSAFWDFTSDGEYTNEHVPEQLVLRQPLEWFWEPSHYRAALGDLMLDTMLADACQSTPEFGRRVYPADAAATGE